MLVGEVNDDWGGFILEDIWESLNFNWEWWGCGIYNKIIYRYKK